MLDEHDGTSLDRTTSERLGNAAQHLQHSPCPHLDLAWQTEAGLPAEAAYQPPRLFTIRRQLPHQILRPRADDGQNRRQLRRRDDETRSQRRPCAP